MSETKRVTSRQVAEQAVRAAKLPGPWEQARCARCDHVRGQHWQYHHVCQECQDVGANCVAFMTPTLTSSAPEASDNAPSQRPSS